MSEINKLSPVFPIQDLNNHPGPLWLSLRDYFAAKAMPFRTFASGCVDQCAVECYEIADAMLRARGKK